MKIIVADVYTFYIHNSKNTKFPKKFRSHKIIWDLRQTLMELWTGEVTEIAIPKLGTPGYDFPEFIDKMKEIGNIKQKPKIVYYELNITSKS